jgi:Zn-finger nucleic acid-binding protein
VPAASPGRAGSTPAANGRVDGHEVPSGRLASIHVSREGIEIDFCPQCRGVWLDRGELDKIIERTSAATAPASGGGSVSERHEDDRRYDDRSQRRPKKRSFLGDLFEFGGGD